MARLTPAAYFHGTWQVSGPETAREFSAIGYEFGRALQQRLDVPVGMIHVAVGGSPTEAWIQPEALESVSALKPLVAGDWLLNKSIADWCRERGQQNLNSANAQTPSDDLGYNHPFKPGFLWQSGIAPLIPCAVRGVLWYQGESNAQDLRRVEQHAHSFPLLVQSWRKHWEQPELPFLFCQLSSISTASGYQSHFWPEFRDQQRQLADQLDHTAMVVTSDVGQLSDVHPRDKQTVARRLFQAALATVYKEKTAYSGPLPSAVSLAANKITIKFREADRGLQTSDGKPPASLEIGDEQRNFASAPAVIQNDALIISAVATKMPRYIRYGWQPYSQGNLTNAEQLPASTFEVTVPTVDTGNTR